MIGWGQFIERTELGSGGREIAAERLKDNPRRLGKGRVRLVGRAPLRETDSQGLVSGGRIHQFLWRRSRVASEREKGTERPGAIRSRAEPGQVARDGFGLGPIAVTRG